MYEFDQYIRNPSQWCYPDSYDTSLVPGHHPTPSQAFRPPPPPTARAAKMPVSRVTTNPIAQQPRTPLATQTVTEARDTTTAPRRQRNCLSPHSLVQQHFNTSAVTDSNALQESRIIKRNNFDPSKCKWDGTHSTFHYAKAALHGYVMMSLMAYIIRPHLLRAYKDGYYGQTSSFYDQYADAYGRSLADNGISKKQFLYDNEALLLPSVVSTTLSRLSIGTWKIQTVLRLS